LLALAAYPMLLLLLLLLLLQLSRTGAVLLSLLFEQYNVMVVLPRGTRNYAVRTRPAI
jgi:hypothetical protein